jgi:hypothetical protein
MKLKLILECSKLQMNPYETAQSSLFLNSNDKISPPRKSDFREFIDRIKILNFEGKKTLKKYAINSKSKNSKNESETKKMELRMPSINIDIPKVFSRNSNDEYDSGLKYLANFWRIMIKLFANMNFNEEDFSLTSIERILLIEVVKKKKFSKNKRINFTSSIFNLIKNANLRKKKEDNLKFMFNYSIKNLKKQFRKKILKDCSISNHELEEQFFNFYYSEISKNHGIPMESFFNLKKWKNGTSSLMHKSISKLYISRLKLNMEFIKILLKYIKNDFLNSFTIYNLNKIRRLSYQWDKILQKYGIKEGVNKIKSKINSVGIKMPWTVGEVLHAKQTILETLLES